MTSIISGYLNHQPVPTDRKQNALTKRFIFPVLTDLHDMLMDLRRELDPVLARQYPLNKNIPYPVGRCEEITTAVRQHLLKRIATPTTRAERALHAFRRQGGLIRPVWGALRERYFQNATQIGSLYVDAANDTVNITKPKVEIMPMTESGLEAIRDISHFCDIAKLYWKAETYANLVAPSLAPLLPMAVLNKVSEPQLLSACPYMTALALHNHFRDAESWLETAPAMDIAAQAPLLERVPIDLRPRAGADPRELAIDACREARREKRYLDPEWKQALLKDLARINSPRLETGDKVQMA
ncbi:hypothetical protein [Niveispirillum cyanobacteriorum]|uniref:Uncharacterized protein n=1 Tax=Niveispirillum cyanobacteriorum TaxID=1612173 RepID=A0A2K9NKA1_9PROT|nr:hypothetical protein [Niveispirillum cyanobacteriorum]AUN33500.1 hypothetical protein C0V82_24460 [Niveispirillum cyanobacteriorum]